MSKTAENFVNKFWDDAVAVEQKYGVPVGITLTMGAIESAYGKSPIGNNYFGIKADKYWISKGKKYTNTKTHEYDPTKGLYPDVQPFRLYDSVREGWLDFGRLIRHGWEPNGYWKKAKPFLSDPPRAIEAITQPPFPAYATGPSYPKAAKNFYAALLPYIQKKKAVTEPEQ